MKITELNELSSDELVAKRREFKEETLNLRLQQQSGQLENPARIRMVRRTIARIETVLNARRLQASSK